MSTANGDCVAVTDASGLELASDGTDLKASGVTLTAAQAGACSPAGGGSSSSTFDVSASAAAAAPTVGTQFQVAWSAGGDATRCVRGGDFTNQQGMLNWKLGSLACSGAACAGNHVEQVTAAAPGTYKFSVLCTNDSGYASTQNVVVPTPPSPAPTPSQFALTAPATVSPGIPFTVTWPTLTNAASCKGTGSLGGVDAPDLGDWTSLLTVGTSRSVTVPASGAGKLLKLTLKCANADASASATGVSGDIAVTVSSAACPATINTAYGQRTYVSTVSRITWGAVPIGGHDNVDVSKFANIWGFNSGAPGTALPWPGVGGSAPVLKSVPRQGYIGAHFKTTASPPPSGFFINPSFQISPNLIMSISKVCGDFSEQLPTPGCLRDAPYGEAPGSGTPSSDTSMVSWKFTSNNPTGYCNLQPNTDYYINIMFANPAACTGERCNIAVINQR
ncbi:MAG: hypothetical protein J0H15_02770 [Xanthomonadales bacterium]|nr:hypothetical protein [Xanthomonadales bacterium]